MGQYEPHDSRNVPLKQDRAPGEPPRTGPREGETRAPAQPDRAGLEQDERDNDAEATVDRTGAGQMGAADAEAEAELRERAMERDADELDAAARGRND